MYPKVGLDSISFPVYHLGRISPEHQNGVSFYLIGSDIGYSDEKLIHLVLDDKKYKQATLGLRRMALQADGAKLFKLSRAVFFIGDMIKIAKNGNWFIDTEGNIFQYTKTTRVKLVYKKIKKLVHTNSGAIVDIVGIPARFKILYKPVETMQYAGLLQLGASYILYGLYDKEYKDSYRLI